MISINPYIIIITINTLFDKTSSVFASLILVAALIAVNFISGNASSPKAGHNSLKTVSVTNFVPNITAEAATMNLDTLDTANALKTTVSPLPATDDEAVLMSNSSPFFSSSNKTASQSGDFLMPTQGYDWGILHGNNAVDIANICGTPVYAAKDGFVVKAAADNGWNDGFGNYVELEHSDKIQTLYAHLDSINTSVGKYAGKGTLIGYMGATGDVTGVTGCHLHFEVHGAKNPFVK